MATLPKTVWTYDNLACDERTITDAPIRKLTNYRLHPQGYFINDRGWERLKLFPDDTVHPYNPDDFEPTRFLSIWSRHDNAETYYLWERNGFLLYEYGIGDGVADGNRVFLANSHERHIPEPSEVGTQLINVGPWALICNGVDEPTKFLGRTQTTQFSWRSKPSAPRIWDINPAVFPTGPISFTYAATAVRINNRIPGLPDEDAGTYYGITTEHSSGSVTFKYKVSFVSDTGSESPLSEEATLDFYISIAGRFVAFLELPIGPDNTVARRIYRTLDLSGEAAEPGGVFYLVRQVQDNTTVMVSDIMPDTSLLIEAPSPIDSVPVVGTFNYGCVFDNRLWLAGGPTYTNQVIYSAPGLFEQFGALASFTYNAGGNITGLTAFGGALYVFFENSISRIVFIDGEYRSTVITNEIGTTATNSIQSVPGAGLMFLTLDGFYAIQPNVDSSANNALPTVAKMSEQINETLSRLNRQSMPRATSVYNPVEREYWCHLPVDGLDENNLGCVLHNNGVWTFRERVSESRDRRSMVFPHLAFDGVHTIIGTLPFDTLDSADPVDGDWHNIGLQVWCAADQWGQVLSDGEFDEETDTYTFTVSDGTRDSSIIESNWLIFGNDMAFKRIKSVELLLLGTGYLDVDLDYAVDYRDGVYRNAGTRKASHSTYLNTTSSDPIYSVDGDTGVATAYWGQAIVNTLRPCRVRWPIAVSSVNSFKFKVTTDDLIGIHSFAVVADTTSIGTIDQRS